ncbi:MAG TPA: MBL fold metallo-hydrolase [Candidatus Babeliales bacterium]|nr:MBL fold metallo-hydrolase [Candidatus Babeliales bacterium]
MSTKPLQRIYPYKSDGRYYNYQNEKIEGYLFHMIYEYLRYIKLVKRKTPTDLMEWVSKPLLTYHYKAEPEIVWIGHSSFLIQIGGINILTDPIFGGSTIFYRRILPAGVSLEQLPPIHFILISHNHMDHMDAAALEWLRDQHPGATFLVPEGDKKWFDARGFAHVVEHGWWQKYGASKVGRFAENIQFTFLPAVHWSQRSLFDKNCSLWGSWLIEKDGYTIYFAGDTAYSEHFALIAQECAPIDIALMPIAPCEPRKWMAKTHMGVQESVQAFLDLGARHFVPMHWGTFAFGEDEFDAPLFLLKDWWYHQRAHLAGKQMHIVKVGESRTFGLQKQLEVASITIFPEKTV